MRLGIFIRVFALFLLTVLLTSSCDKLDNLSNIPVKKYQRIQILHQELKRKRIEGKPLVWIIEQKSDSSSISITRNMKWALDYTKIPYKVVNLKNFKNLHIPSSVRVVCYTPTNADLLKNNSIENLIKFVAAGNSLILTSPLWNPRMAFLQGIKPVASYEVNKKAKGYDFKLPIFPGFKDRIVNGPGYGLHYGLNRKNFLKKIKVFATAANDSAFPVVLENKIGGGKVILFNTSTMAGKQYRGMLFSSIIKGLAGTPYLTANVSTIFIDDFPQPLYYDIKPPIKKEYDITDAQFVTKVWWPDMKKLANKFHFKYSCMLVFNYNNETTPPFYFQQWTHAKVNIDGHKVEASPWLMRQAKKQGYEIGYHGYNHISLMKDNWGNERNMVISIHEARKEWMLQHVGPLPVTYVAPNDYIDSLGIQSLVKAMPSIKYLCTTFEDSVVTGNGREFTFDPYSSKLFDYPRITSGYVDNNTSLFNEENVYMFSGIWTHFIHPDDVYDLPRYGGEGGFGARNIHGLGWHPFGKHKEGLYEVFTKRLKNSFKMNPLLRIKPAKAAVPIVERWRSSKVTRINKSSINEIKYKNSLKGSKNALKYWYVYVPRSEKDIFKKLIRKQSIRYAKVNLWDGYLYEFNTRHNTLYFPKFTSYLAKNDSLRKRIEDSAISDYLNYQTIRDSMYADEVKNQNYNPLKKALKALKKDPYSLSIQNKVIKLGNEYDKLDLSIDLLKERLLNNTNWHMRDVNLLIKYYSWQNDDNIWNFLNELWQRYPEKKTIKLKDQVVQQFGYPNDQLRKKWLLRSIQTFPANYKLKKKFAYDFQSEKDWPTSKKYLLSLIKRFPQSDTLYRFTFRRSTWYDSPDSTLKLLNRFPDSSHKQLSVFDGEIANLYAYNGNDITKAIQWAEKDPNYNQETILNWLLGQKRYAGFKSRSTLLLKRDPDNDSLRTFIGLAYLDNGYNDMGYRTLYPLFKKQQTDSTITNRITDVIAGLSYYNRKKLYYRYPDFFLNKTKQKLFYTHRIEEGVAPGISASYSSDNFKNTLASTQISTSWGERLKYTHTLSIGYYKVASDINNHSRNNALQKIAYQYQRYLKGQKYQLNATAGVVLLPNSSVLPNLSSGFSMNGKLSYTSLSAAWSPVYTNIAVRNRYNKLNSSLYNEFYLLKKHLGLSQSLTGNRYSNNVYSWEFDGRIYYVPHPKFYFNIKPEIMYSYSSATRNYDSGIPYWTPHNLQIEGAGLMWTYNKQKTIPKFTMDGEMLLNNDNKNGLYVTSNVSLNMKLFKYWQLSLQGDVSTSKVYRSNALTLSFSYFLPNKLK